MCGEDVKLITSEAANTDIISVLLLNPNVLGVGMAGGTYTGNQRGSIIREAFFVNIANAWTDGQNLMDPIKLKFHISEYTNVELHFQNKVLTTLDTEAKTK